MSKVDDGRKKRINVQSGWQGKKREGRFNVEQICYINKSTNKPKRRREPKVGRNEAIEWTGKQKKRMMI